jgi:hypothetical protein
MKAKLILSIIALMAISIMPSCKEEKNIKKFIVGQWSFDKFKWSDESGYRKDQQLNFENSNKGTILQFFDDGRLNTIKMKDGKFINSQSVSYQVLPDDKRIVLGNDTSEVSEINDTYLKLFHENRPVVVFKRINNSHSR